MVVDTLTQPLPCGARRPFLHVEAVRCGPCTTERRRIANEHKVRCIKSGHLQCSKCDHCVRCYHEGRQKTLTEICAQCMPGAPCGIEVKGMKAKAKATSKATATSKAKAKAPSRRRPRKLVDVRARTKIDGITKRLDKLEKLASDAHFDARGAQAMIRHANVDCQERHLRIMKRVEQCVAPSPVATPSTAPRVAVTNAPAPASTPPPPPMSTLSSTASHLADTEPAPRLALSKAIEALQKIVDMACPCHNLDVIGNAVERFVEAPRWLTPNWGPHFVGCYVAIAAGALRGLKMRPATSTTTTKGPTKE